MNMVPKSFATIETIQFRTQASRVIGNRAAPNNPHRSPAAHA